MNSRINLRLLTTRAALLVSALLVLEAVVPGEDKNPDIAPPNSNPHGTSYARWGAAWWQWVLSLPANNPPNPLLRTGSVDCSYGQFGHVWFLVGILSGGTVARSCSVPTGTWLFLPVLNAWADNTGVDSPTMFTLDQLKELAAGLVNSPVELHASIDGAPVQNLLAYRAAYAPFGYLVPATDNLLQFLGENVPGAGWPTRFVFPAASDGYWLMLKPLPPGPHTINFGATTATQFQLDITYQITVVPRGHF